MHGSYKNGLEANEEVSRMEKVSAARCDSYEESIVFQAVREAIRKIGFELPEGKRVLIKPNIMSQNKPEQHTITHYSVINAICRLLKERNNDIFIGESIAFYQKGLTQKAFETSGILQVAQKYEATLVEFEKVDLVKIRKGEHEVEGLDELFIPSILLDVDMVINACKLKSHSAMRFSGAIKNMYGCLPGGYKQKIHQWVNSEFELSNVFIDIHKIIKPVLSIMDAIVSLDGGPTALGKPVNTGVVLASENPAALDIVAATMIGYKVDEIPMFIQAKRRGMIREFEDIQIIGEIKPVQFRKLVKEGVDRPYDNSSIFVKHTYVNLRIDTNHCNKCEKCITSCPVKAIHLKEKCVDLDTRQCINCYYCISICPNEAIKINPTLMNRLGWGIRKITGL